MCCYGGEPGIGKSTLILQICDKMKGEGKVLYVSGEESAEQIKMRADRLQINNEDIMFLGETDIDIIAQATDFCYIYRDLFCLRCEKIVCSRHFFRQKLHKKRPCRNLCKASIFNGAEGRTRTGT